jgi:hypothetical protein
MINDKKNENEILKESLAVQKKRVKILMADNEALRENNKILLDQRNEYMELVEQFENEIKNLREENKKLKKKYYDVLDQRNEYMYITEQLREEIKYKEE